MIIPFFSMDGAPLRNATFGEKSSERSSCQACCRCRLPLIRIAASVTNIRGEMSRWQDRKVSRMGDLRALCPVCREGASPVFGVAGFLILECSACEHRFCQDAICEKHAEAIYDDTYFFGGGVVTTITSSKLDCCARKDDATVNSYQHTCHRVDCWTSGAPRVSSRRDWRMPAGIRQVSSPTTQWQPMQETSSGLLWNTAPSRIHPYWTVSMRSVSFRLSVISTICSVP